MKLYPRFYDYTPEPQPDPKSKARTVLKFLGRALNNPDLMDAITKSVALASTATVENPDLVHFVYDSASLEDRPHPQWPPENERLSQC